MMEQIKQKQIKEILLISFVLIGLLAILVTAFILAKNANSAEKTENEQVQQTTASSTDPFEDIKISGRSAIVKDLSSGKVLYQKEPDLQLPLASLTKVMTTVTALEILNEEDLIKITNESLSVGNDSSFVSGEHFRLKDIIKIILVSSSNSGANALAYAGGEKIKDNTSTALESFVDKMNSTASKIGMEKTSFKNPTGLDEDNETKASAFGSARDVSKLFEYVFDKNLEIFDSTKEDFLLIKSKEGFEHKIINTNEILGKLPNIIGSKTGYTDIAGGNLAVVIDPALNTPVIIVVLGSSKDGRFKDVERLSNATLDYFLINKK